MPPLEDDPDYVAAMMQAELDRQEKQVPVEVETTLAA
jgi:hypothetical protein